MLKPPTPAHWRHGQIGDLVRQISAGTSVNAEDRRVGKGEIGVLKTSCIANGSFQPDEHKAVLGEEIRRVRTPVRSGTIIICRKNSPELVGLSAYVGESYPRLFLPDLLWELIPRPTVEARWLGYILATSQFRKKLVMISSGTSQSMRNISMGEFLNLPVEIPSRVEQRGMVEILETWDEAIKKSTIEIEAQTRHHSWLTNQLVFGRLRVGNISATSSTTNHRWFELPSEWSVEPIGNLASEISEANSNVDTYEVLSCTKYEGFVRSLDYFKKQIFSKNLVGYKRIYRGDFGFPSNHIEEGSIGLQELTDLGLVSPIYTVFRFDPRAVDNRFAIRVLKSRLYRHIFQIGTSASVDRRGSLRWREFKKIPFPLPSLEEQQAISATLESESNMVELLRQNLSALQRQKRGLMQKLLTGEWRVPMKDVDVEQIGVTAAEVAE